MARFDCDLYLTREAAADMWFLTQQLQARALFNRNAISLSAGQIGDRVLIEDFQKAAKGFVHNQ